MSKIFIKQVFHMRKLGNEAAKEHREASLSGCQNASLDTLLPLPHCCIVWSLGHSHLSMKYVHIIGQ